MVKILWKLFMRVTTGTALLVLFGVFVSVLVQVISRRLGEVQVLWTDEIAKICFVWSVYLGSILVAEDDSFIRLDFADSFLPNRVQKALHVGFRLVALASAIVAIPASVQLVRTNLNYRLSFTKLPYAWLYAAGIVFFAGLTAVSALKLVIRSRNRKQ